MPRNSSRNRFNDDYDQFEYSDRPSRRFKPQNDDLEDDYMEGGSQRRNISRAIPESAVSRRRSSLRDSQQFENDEPKRRRNRSEDNRMIFLLDQLLLLLIEHFHMQKIRSFLLIKTAQIAK